MSGKKMQYACECAAASGFAILDMTIAMTLRPDLWSSAQDCWFAFRGEVALPGTKAVLASLDGLNEPVIVLTRSTNRLAERIEEVTGRHAVVLGDYQPAPKPQPAESPLVAENRRRQEEKTAEYRKLAAEQLPSHDGPHKAAILEARAELAKLDGKQSTSDA